MDFKLQCYIKINEWRLSPNIIDLCFVRVFVEKNKLLYVNVIFLYIILTY